jgi:hypothetical protein
MKIHSTVLELLDTYIHINELKKGKAIPVTGHTGP